MLSTRGSRFWVILHRVGINHLSPPSSRERNPFSDHWLLLLPPLALQNIQLHSIHELDDCWSVAWGPFIQHGSFPSTNFPSGGCISPQVINYLPSSHHITITFKIHKYMSKAYSGSRECISRLGSLSPICWQFTSETGLTPHSTCYITFIYPHCHCLCWHVIPSVLPWAGAGHYCLVNRSFGITIDTSCFSDTCLPNLFNIPSINCDVIMSQKKLYLIIFKDLCISKACIC